jgi:hypothetical protein
VITSVPCVKGRIKRRSSAISFHNNRQSNKQQKKETQLVQIIQPGFVPTRKTFAELYSSPPQNMVKARKLRIIAPCGMRGVPVYPGSVFAFDLGHADYYEDFACLTGSLKAERVSIDTPLVIAPAPVEPPPLPAVEKAPSMKELIHALTTALKVSKA